MKKILVLLLTAFAVVPAQSAQNAPKDVVLNSGQVRYVAPSADGDARASGMAGVEEGTLAVSSHDYNRFTASVPITQVIFSSNAPIADEPTYMAGNTSIFIQFDERATSGPIQAIFELSDGTIVQKYLKILPVRGQTYSLDSTRRGPKALPTSAPAESPGAEVAATTGSPYAADVQLLEQLVQGVLPEEFAVAALPPVAAYDELLILPLGSWDDGHSRKVSLFQLQTLGATPVRVAPNQFYRPGVRVVTVDLDTVSPESRPLLYVVEEAAE